MSRRDTVAGVLVVGAVVAWVVGDVVGLLGVRATAGVVTALGITAALVGGWWLRPVRDPWIVNRLAALGVLTAIAAAVALVAGRPEPLLLLVVLTAGLWVLATVRHTRPRP